MNSSRNLPNKWEDNLSHLSEKLLSVLMTSLTHTHIDFTVVVICRTDNRIVDSIFADSIGYKVLGSNSTRLHANHGTPHQSSNASQVS